MSVSTLHLYIKEPGGDQLDQHYSQNNVMGWMDTLFSLHMESVRDVLADRFLNLNRARPATSTAPRLYTRLISSQFQVST